MIEDFIILITRFGMGDGPEELQLTLLAKYLAVVSQNDRLPFAICFYTEGVKLVTEGSPVLEQLRTLEAKKVRLVACSTCLDYFHVSDKLEVGIAGSMADIVEAQLRALKVITI